MNYVEYMNEFNANVYDIKNAVIRWIRDWFKENGNGCRAVIGISGGKDSSVVAALCVEALGKEKVFGILMPNGNTSDIEDSFSLVSHLDIDFAVYDIKETVESVLTNMQMPLTGSSLGEHIIPKEQTIINLPCRIRMATLYAVSQSVNGRVANTCNLSEDWVGYSTRWGDSVGDFSPLSSFTTDEVVAIGKACGLPNELVEKIPADGLCGKTDEENLGFSYRVLNEYIRTGICEDANIKKLIDDKHSKNLFKLLPMPSFDYLSSPWRSILFKEDANVQTYEA